MQLIDESIKLELNVADLYTIFCKAFPGDYAFWSKLALEEEHHASLIRGARDAWLPGREFPHELLAPKVDMLLETNSKLVSLLEEYRHNPPSREIAFNVAFNLEESAGEVHFQRAMEQPPTSTIMEVFQLLNRDEKDHARRILAYMSDKGIELRKNLIK
jgi:hypothetical protein